MDNIMNRWKTLSVTAEEEEVVGIADTETDKGKAEIGFGLLGRASSL